MPIKQTIQFDPSLVSAFGTLETGELTPVLQGDFTYGLNVQTWNTPLVNGTGAAVDTNSGRLRVQSGTGGSGNYAYITSKKIIRYRAGQGTVARFTPLFTVGVANSIQLWGVGSIVANAPYDGFFFGYNGLLFGIFHYISGVATFYPQDSTTVNSWNGDKVNGSNGTSFTWNPVNGSPVMIKYPYLGYGNVQFFVQNTFTSEWVLVHTIKYANTSPIPELSNPSLQFIGFTSSTGSVTNLTMYCASVGVFISGTRNFISNPGWSADNYKTGITVETCIFNIQNCASYNGVPNRGMLRLSLLGCSVNGGVGNIAFIRLVLNATIGGTPAYNPIGGGATADNGVTITGSNSIASKDVAGTTITGGIQRLSISLPADGSENIKLDDHEILIAPGDILSVTGFGVTSSVIGIGLSWTEDI